MSKGSKRNERGGFETEDAVDVGSIVSLTDGWIDSMKSDNVKKREKSENLVLEDEKECN